MTREINPDFEKEIIFTEAAARIADKGYEIFVAEHGPEGKSPKEFHGPWHLERMLARGEKMAEVFRFSEARRLVLKMVVNWHDTVIEYNPADPSKLLAMIARHRGARDGDYPSGREGNEGQSGRGLQTEMKAVNPEKGPEIFSDELVKNAGWAVDATYPDAQIGADYNGVPFVEYPFLEEILRQNPAIVVLLGRLRDQDIQKGKLFAQPHLENYLEQNEDVPREVLIAGLTDLGAAGMDSSEIYFSEGDAEMRELYGNIRKPEVLKRLTEGDIEVDIADRQKVAQAFLKWLDDQTGFAVWQCLRFEKIVFLLKRNKKLTTREETGLRKLFGHFEENIRAAQERAKRLRLEFEATKETNEKVAFKNLAKEVGYKF